MGGRCKSEKRGGREWEGDVKAKREEGGNEREM